MEQMNGNFKILQIKAGVNLPSPYILRRKILIKNKIEKRVADSSTINTTAPASTPPPQADRKSGDF